MVAWLLPFLKTVILREDPDPVVNDGAEWLQIGDVHYG